MRVWIRWKMSGDGDDSPYFQASIHKKNFPLSLSLAPSPPPPGPLPLPDSLPDLRMSATAEHAFLSSRAFLLLHGLRNGSQVHAQVLQRRQIGRPVQPANGPAFHDRKFRKQGGLPLLQEGRFRRENQLRSTLQGHSGKCRRCDPLSGDPPDGPPPSFPRSQVTKPDPPMPRRALSAAAIAARTRDLRGRSFGPEIVTCVLKNSTPLTFIAPSLYHAPKY